MGLNYGTVGMGLEESSRGKVCKVANIKLSPEMTFLYLQKQPNSRAIDGAFIISFILNDGPASYILHNTQLHDLSSLLIHYGLG